MGGVLLDHSVLVPVGESHLCDWVVWVMTLEQLAVQYSSDKFWAHSYIPYYDELFRPIREKVKCVLEIGIGYEELMQPFVPEYVPASSLKMWRDYFPNAI